jgi:NADH:ubiquinone oxidoreductase subunit K
MMDYVILSLILLSIGIYGLLTKRDLLKVFVSVELIATAATLNFVMLVPALGKGLGEAFLILAFSTDTCVSGVILALLVVVHKKYGTSDIGDLVKIEQEKEKEEIVRESEVEA